MPANSVVIGSNQSFFKFVKKRYIRVHKKPALSFALALIVRSWTYFALALVSNDRFLFEGCSLILCNYLSPKHWKTMKI